MKKLLTAVLFSALLVSSHATVINIPVAGGTFEPDSVSSPTTPTAPTSPGYIYQGGTYSVTGFTISSQGGDVAGFFNGSVYGFGGDTSQLLFLNDSYPDDPSTVTSDPLTTIVAGSAYTATVEIGNQPGTGANYTDPGNITLDLYATTTGLTPTTSLVAQHVTDSGSLAQSTFGTFGVSLTAAQTASLGGEILTFQIVGDATSDYLTSPGTGTEPIFDNVMLSETTAPSSTPEPATWALLLASLTLLFAYRRLPS